MIWALVIVGVLIVVARFWWGQRAALALVVLWIVLAILGGVFHIGVRR